MDLPSPRAELDLIRRVADEAAVIALQYFQRESLAVDYKNNNSPVSEGDIAVDTFLRETLTAARPDYGWLSEETVDKDPQFRVNKPRTFIVDPIDGTRAYIGGFDTWCISVAVVENGRPVAGVLNCPALMQVYSACSGDDSDTTDSQEMPEKACVGGNSSMVRFLRRSLPQVRITESGYVPSLAYRIAMVADGRLAGTFIRKNAHEWDLAAADLIASKTGVRLVDENGNRIAYNRRDPRMGPLVCAVPALIEPMLDVVSKQSIG